ncbi:helix-turn-helix domain-containing protein [Mycobacterium yunnanensis]|uniref:Helix-turn-helix domain-containing protein n=1 Tax=Mycobacterium yunnanensis TaxID=368477 RepID=A0A9X2YZS1_9MYCO|nr:helix-turn-helix domain-containing protein [Mycobacterium yunnanensis]MCV7420399.1 helix-turn-helix domain-containing protein [Mycobacterium yunnanensis]
MARPWFTALEPTECGARLGDSVLLDRAHALAERLGDGPAGWAVDMGARMATAITAEIPQLAVDAVATEVHKGCEAVALGALAALAHDDDVTFGAMTEVLAGPTEVVARGIGIEHMLRSIHVAHATAASALLDVAERVVPEPQRFGEMRRINQVLFGIVDVVTERMAAEYSRAQQEWLTSSIALRTEIVEDLLSGTAVPTERATRILGYDLTRWHLAVVVWTDASTPAEPAHLTTAAAEMLSAAGCSATLLLPVGAHRVWAWGSRTLQPPDVVAPVTPPVPGVCVAIGMAGAGVDGFRDSHRQAADAARVGALSTRTTRSFRYEDLDLVAMLSTNLRAAREFVARELGDLAVDSESVATMRRTLKCYLDRERSLARSAADLSIARNTVAYRVQRAEQLRGRPASERRLQLHAALALAEELGDAVLTTPAPSLD